MSQYPRGPFWSSNFFTDSGIGAFAKFSVADKDALEIYPSLFGAARENLPCASGMRLRHSVYDGEHSLQFKSDTPSAGAEISRRFEFTGGFIEIVNDLSLRRELAISAFEFDPVKIAPGWNFSKCLVWNGADGCAEWIEEPSAFKSHLPILCAVFTSPDEKKCVEIGSGDDLWRWTLASLVPDARSFFSIKKDKEGSWNLRRALFSFKEPSLFPVKKLRLSWYIAFSCNESGKADAENRRQDEMIELALDGQQWQGFAGASWKGADIGMLCLHASATRKALRRLIRQASSSLAGGGHLVLKGIDLAICDCSSHLGRGDGKRRPHWNILELNRFKKWARRNLARSGRGVRIAFSEKSPSREIPSAHL